MKKKYVSIARASMQNVIAYRFNYIITLISSFIFILSMFYLWKAIYAGSDSIGGYSWVEMKTYLFITYLTNILLSWYSETKISGKILDGSVSMDLLKPIDFHNARLAETVGTSIFEGWVGAIFIATYIIIFSGILLPQNGIIGVLLFVISLIFSLLIKFGIVYVFGLLCFWTSSGLGIVWSRVAITNLFSGALVPLTFFPDWLKSIALVLPFQGIVYIPASIYLGRAQTEEAIQLVGLQMLWIIVLWIAGKLIWRWAVRQVTIFGG